MNFRVCSAAVLVPGSTCSMVAVPCVISCCRVCVLLLWTLDAAVFVENSVDKHFGVIIVITNCRSKELTTTVMLNGEGIFFELEFYIIRNFTERTLTHSHHVTLFRHDFCRY